MPGEMLGESTSRPSTTGPRTKTIEEAGETERGGMGGVEEGAEIRILRLSHSQPHNLCVEMSLLIRGKWRSKVRSQPLQEPSAAS